MKYHPILCRDEVVRAILRGDQVQDRRPIKPQPDGDVVGFSTQHMRLDRVGERYIAYDGYYAHKEILCPWTVGDRLWVREKWSGPYYCCGVKPSERTDHMVWYWADGDVEWGDWEIPRPSIHMPRWASRITLEITGIRVEQVQDISEADVLAEGVGLTEWAGHPEWPRTAGFAELWDSIYSKHDLGFDSGCWVWVREFRVVQACDRHSLCAVTYARGKDLRTQQEGV